MLLKWVPENTNFDFVGKRFIAFALSALLVIASIGMLMTKGLNFGVDFTGGTMIEIKVSSETAPDLTALRGALNELDLGSISIQEFGAPDDLMVRLPEQVDTAEEIATRNNCLETSKVPENCPQTAQAVALEKVRGVLDSNFEAVDYRRTEFVGPQVGEELKQKGIMAVIFSILGMLVYIWFRFEWQFSVAAIAALMHDAIATIGLFAFTQMEFNLSTVAAILMIAGYSINDTVVVFDRIRENLRKFKKMPIMELLNNAINQTLSRTLMTSGTTILALVALWVFGGEVIRGFVNALIFGIGIGTYSSIFVAAPVLTFLNIRHEKKSAAETTSESA